MHPMERLRYVARASGVSHDVIAREFANSLGPVVQDPAELVTICRRIVSRHPLSGPLWTVCSRVLTSPEPYREAWKLADELEEDRTPRELSHALADGARVVVLGWPDHIAAALPRRGDVEPFVVDTLGEGSGLVRRLVRSDIDAVDVPLSGLAGAVVGSDVVLLETSALGPTEAICVAGSRAAAATAAHAGVPVWLVAGVGRAVPGPVWDVITDRMPEPAWDADEELVPLDLVSQIVGPSGLRTVAEVVANLDLPIAPELFKPGIAL